MIPGHRPRFSCAQCHWSVGVTATTLACLMHECAAIRICSQFVYEPGSYEPEPDEAQPS